MSSRGRVIIPYTTYLALQWFLLTKEGELEIFQEVYSNGDKDQ